MRRLGVAAAALTAVLSFLWWWRGIGVLGERPTFQPPPATEPRRLSYEEIEQVLKEQEEAGRIKFVPNEWEELEANEAEWKALNSVCIALGGSSGFHVKGQIPQPIERIARMLAPLVFCNSSWNQGPDLDTLSRFDATIGRPKSAGSPQGMWLTGFRVLPGEAPGETNLRLLYVIADSSVESPLEVKASVALDAGRVTRVWIETAWDINLIRFTSAHRDRVDYSDNGRFNYHEGIHLSNGDRDKLLETDSDVKVLGYAVSHNGRLEVWGYSVKAGPMVATFEWVSGVLTYDKGVGTYDEEPSTLPGPLTVPIRNGRWSFSAALEPGQYRVTLRPHKRGTEDYERSLTFVIPKTAAPPWN
ncbi:MAG: hypothetical protein ACK41F_01640 [Fimbriimonadaceae bacterium]